MKRKIIQVIDGKSFQSPPVWLMRQAGRYLPEYQAIRNKIKCFMDLCYDPEHVVSITMQPIQRFEFDAAILFSDILTIPDVLGQKVHFKDGIGPTLEPIDIKKIDLLEVDSAIENLKPVLEAVSDLRKKLPDETALIGFCGAPWTVATYMIAGEGTKNQFPARIFAYKHQKQFQKLIKILVDVSSDYLVAQLKAGADAVQIFDSWAGVLDNHEFQKWCIEPVKKIVRLVRNKIPDAKIIGFPKGAGFELQKFISETGINAISIDWTTPLDIAKELQKNVAVQGNLDPVRLIVGGSVLEDGVKKILRELGSGPLIFNLGHGISPDTPISNVEKMLKYIRN